MNRGAIDLRVEANRLGLEDEIRSFVRESFNTIPRAPIKQLGWFAILKDGTRWFMAPDLERAMPKLQVLKQELKQKMDTKAFIERNRALDERFVNGKRR